MTLARMRLARLVSAVALLRPPLPEEEPELYGMLDWAHRRRWWLAGGYAAFLAWFVRPAFFEGRGPAYIAVAILASHLMLYYVFASVVHMTVGYRANFGNYGRVLHRLSAERQVHKMVVGFVAIAALGGFVGAFVALAPQAEAHLRHWFARTFTIELLIGVLLFGGLFIQDTISRLRTRQSELAARVSAAEAITERGARRRVESELRLLQAQVEPHFLYNTLANLRWLIQSGSPDALRMIDSLIDYLRTAVSDIREPTVALGREIEHVRHYLEIMQMRMQGRLRWEVEMSPDAADVPVPPLVVLTLAENAVKHGIAPQVDGGRVRIVVTRDIDRVMVRVEDTGAGLRDTPTEAHDGPSTGTGLENVRERLRLAYGDAASVTLAPNAPRGAVAMLALPDRPRATEPASAEREGAVPTLAALPCLAYPRRELRGPRRRWSLDVRGRRVEVVNAWIGGAELRVDGEFRCANPERYPDPDRPFLSATFAGDDGRPTRVDALWVPRWNRIAVALYVDGRYAGGDWVPGCTPDRLVHDTPEGALA